MLLERFTDFKVGDVVRIRSWEDMENEYGLKKDSYGEKTIPCLYSFTDRMKIFCNEKAKIIDKPLPRLSDGKKQ